MADRSNNLIVDLDVQIFAIESQSTSSDKISFLLLQNIARNFFGQYHYLEIGSHLGGSLLPHLLDSRCSSVFSIDKRPAFQPDERGKLFYYNDNSTKRMFDTLSEHVSAGNLLKLRTFDGDANEVSSDLLATKPQLVLIDGEHTNQAAFNDFLSIYRLTEENAIISFHDSDLVMDAIVNAEALLNFLQRKNRLFFLPERVAVFLLGNVAKYGDGLARWELDRGEFLRKSRTNLDEVIAQNVERRNKE